MAVTLSAEKQKAYKEKFSLFDKNNDEKISRDELRAALKALNRDPSDDNLEKVMVHVDKDKSGFIEYNEFVKMMVKIDAGIDQGAKPTFDKYDKDKNGFISPSELNAMFIDLGIVLTPEQLQTEINNVDLNADGKLNFEEFKKLYGRY